MMSFIRTLCVVVTILVTISAPLSAIAADEPASAGKPTWGERLTHPIRWARGDLNKPEETAEQVELPDLSWFMPYEVWPLLLAVIAFLLLGTYAVRRKHGQLSDQHALLLGLGAGFLWVVLAFMIRGVLSKIVEVLAVASLVALVVTAHRAKFLRWLRFHWGIMRRQGIRLAWSLGNLKRLAAGILPQGVQLAPPVAIPPVGAACPRCARPFLPGARGCAFCPAGALPAAPGPQAPPPRAAPAAPQPPPRRAPLPRGRR